MLLKHDFTWFLNRQDIWDALEIDGTPPKKRKQLHSPNRQPLQRLLFLLIDINGRSFKGIMYLIPDVFPSYEYKKLNRIENDLNLKCVGIVERKVALLVVFLKKK